MVMMQGIHHTKVRDNESSRILKRRLDFKPILSCWVAPGPSTSS